jgi:DNA mismatch repair ATPase MutL
MFTERLWDLIKAYINEAVDAALDERGYKRQEQKQQKTHKTAYDEFQEKYEKYRQYQKQNSYQNSYQKSYTSSKSGNADEEKYYRWLELPVGSSFEEIRKSYKALMKKYHPDNFHNNETKRQTAEKLSQKLNEAYQYFEKKNSKK